MCHNRAVTAISVPLDDLFVRLVPDALQEVRVTHYARKGFRVTCVSSFEESVMYQHIPAGYGMRPVMSASAFVS
ncbi:hypothetical protein SNOUR_23950 [Streptomyces noursei ATCC 11455]|nr:hypothetical protein SNOUR_23950 [Streptomyces noursei ATCC 11455]